MHALNSAKPSRGGARPGAGRPVSEAKRKLQELVALKGDILIQAVLVIALDENIAPSSRLQAINMLWDRAFGRPAVESTDVPLNTNVQEVLAKALLADGKR